jgi:Lsr2
MSQRRIVELLDDLDGGSADETLTFGLDGRTYEIDLSTVNAKSLREALAPYAAVARRPAGRAPSGSRVKVPAQADDNATDAAVIREWALASGFDVNSRGRIPANVRAAYESR